MAILIFSAILSLDGYIADQQGNFDWAVPSEQVHSLINDLMQPVGTYLYGRRMYQVMVGWEDLHRLPDPTPVMQEFAKLWQQANKIVYSRTLETVTSARTRLERDFDPQAVREMKQTQRGAMTIAGPELAAQAFRSGLVDECQLFIAPIMVGGGTPALPSDLMLRLELIDQRHFDNGTVYLHYRTVW
jgi:dihydrofolate reductase